jgi:hypothetical protein
MQRRTAVKQLLVIAGGVMVLPSCMHKEDKPSISLKNIQLSASDEKLLAEIADTIIPATDTPGAKDVYTHLYTLKMVDDCSETEQQDQFVKGLKAVNQLAKDRFGKGYTDCNADQRASIVNDLDNRKVDDKNIQSFYTITKKHTVKGYMTSQYVMTKQIVYKLVPGPFHGSYPITQKATA